MARKYLYATKSMEEEAVSDMADTIREWHALKPDYVFLTESSAIPAGYALKETWKKAFPGEKPPKFYRIDPRMIEDQFGTIIADLKRNPNSEMIKGWRSYLSKRINKEKARIIIYDENTPSRFNKPITDVEEDPPSEYGMNSIERVPDFIRKAYDLGLTNKKPGKMYYSTKKFSAYPAEVPKPTSKKMRVGYRALSEDEIYQNKKLEEEKGKGPRTRSLNTPTGFIVSLPEQVRESREFVRYMKDLGRQAGQDLHEQMGSRDNLESILVPRVSVFILASLAGIALTIYSFSPTTTGNVISNAAPIFQSTRGLLGVFLFVFGLAGLVFNLGKRNKKK